MGTSSSGKSAPDPAVCCLAGAPGKVLDCGREGYSLMASGAMFAAEETVKGGKQAAAKRVCPTECQALAQSTPQPSFL